MGVHSGACSTALYCSRCQHCPSRSCDVLQVEDDEGVVRCQGIRPTHNAHSKGGRCHPQTARKPNNNNHPRPTVAVPAGCCTAPARRGLLGRSSRTHGGALSGASRTCGAPACVWGLVRGALWVGVCGGCVCRMKDRTRPAGHDDKRARTRTHVHRRAPTQNHPTPPHPTKPASLSSYEHRGRRPPCP